jgi:hypothetical protein
MPTELARQFRSAMEALSVELGTVPASLAGVPWREGGWTRRQILGHLMDSCANNRQRIVCASLDGSYTGPGYAQELWVEAHGYGDQKWETLVKWWRVEHEILMALVDRIPQERLAAECTVNGNEPITLGFLLTDYRRHQRAHFDQLKTGLPG